MNAINSLVEKLDKTEINLIRAYLIHLNLRDKGDNKLLSLFDFLVKHKGKNPDADKCSMNVYGSIADGRFRAMKFKLKARIIDALISDKNIERENILDDRAVVGLKARKKAAFLNYIFTSKGNIKMVTETIDEILEGGVQNENYVTMIDVLRIKKYLRAFSTGIKEFDEINKQIAFYEYCDQARSKAADYYYKLITRKDFNASLDPKTLSHYLQECIIELNKDFKYTGSGLVGYYLKLLELYYFQEKGDYSSGRNSGIDLLSIIRENKSVYRKQRIGIAFLNIGECDVFLGDYEKALSNFEASEKFFTPGSANFLVAKEAEFKVLIYSEEKDRAQKVLHAVNESIGSDDIGGYKESKFLYYGSVLHFKGSNFKSALLEVSKQIDMADGKTTWSIWVRLMAIMCNMELSRFDEATTLIENLKKFMARNENGADQLSERDKTIVHVLVQLAAAGFQYSDLHEKTLAMLVQLNGTDKKLAWQPMGPELIPFHSWIGTKIPGFAKRLQKALPAKGKKKSLVKDTVKVSEEQKN